MSGQQHEPCCYCGAQPVVVDERYAGKPVMTAKCSACAGPTYTAYTGAEALQTWDSEMKRRNQEDRAAGRPAPVLMSPQVRELLQDVAVRRNVLLYASDLSDRARVILDAEMAQVRP